jgi:hypothetical protein
MHQRAAGGRVEALDRLVHRLAAEPVLVVGPGRTDRLGAQQPAAAGNLLARGHRRRQGIVEQFAGAAGASAAELPRQRGPPCPAHQPATAMPAISGLGRRTRLPSARAYEKVTVGAANRNRRACTRCAKSSSTSALACAAPAAAQQFGRQQRVGARRRRPQVVVHAHHPQGVEFEPGALEDAKHLDGRPAARFRLEDALLTQLRQAAHGFGSATACRAGRRAARSRREPRRTPAAPEIRDWTAGGRRASPPPAGRRKTPAHSPGGSFRAGVMPPAWSRRRRAPPPSADTAAARLRPGARPAGSTPARS